MVEIKQIHKRKDLKTFVKFPMKLYKDSPYYVPAMEMDEFNMTNPKKNANYEESEVVYFLAYKNNQVVGRISGIISHAFNLKNKAKYARFSRFDCINDQEVATALLSAVETWAKEKGMTTVHGPLGFNDLEREGLQTEGFEVEGTFLGNYNYPYYQQLVENYGYTPDAKWVEWRIYVPKENNPRVERVAGIVEKRYGFHEKHFRSTKEAIDTYGKEVFKLLDECYAKLYGTIPFTEKLVQQTINLFKLVLHKDYLCLIFDKNEKLIGFGIGYPSFATAMRKSKGRLLPFGIFRLLHALKHPKAVELVLIAVDPKYQGMGVTSVIITNMLRRLQKHNIVYADTGLQLEDNLPAIGALDMFERELIRRKVCYKKDI